MEEIHPPAKKLKQATLSFFKENKEKPVLKTTVPGQGKKRRNSNSSESPSKSAKLSKSLKILSSSDSPNVKDVRSKSVEDDVQEVSSSSEAENPVSVKSNNGRSSLMEQFLKKVPNDSQQEISSTNNDIDTSVENTSTSCDKSKEALILVESDSDDSDEKSALDEESLSAGNPSAKDNVKVNQPAQEAGETNSKKQDVVEGESLLDTSLSENSSIKLLTSTPLKPTSSSDSKLAVTPTNKSHPESSAGRKLEVTPSNSIKESPSTPATSSCKKRGRKAMGDEAKKVEKEALKEKLRQEKEAQKLERKRKLEETKAEKERLKKERQENKEKERLELREKQAQEKLEKEKIKEEEKRKKEDERLRKEEERQKKLAALEIKQEEKKKKEEDRKRKEEEKLKEEELKTKQAEKVKNAFKSFFVKPTEGTSKAMPAKSSSGMFIPFELKKDMHLAPSQRRDPLSEEDKSTLDQLLSGDKAVSEQVQYLSELRNDDVKPYCTGRILRKNPQPEDEMDIEVIHDSEALKKVFHKVKLLQFHTDYRPPYYGTWRKQTTLTARNPFKKDENMFDYEIDSDDEWEEEEPGESLSCSDGEDDKGDENEDEEEDGWMVPHGYLSEDEGCNEDDEITPEKLKLQQQAKAKAWEEEQKRKLHAVPMIVVGCFFECFPSDKMCGDIRLLYEYKAVVLAPDTPIPTSFTRNLDAEKTDEPVADVPQVTPTPKGPQRQVVPDEAMPDLIRLVHGNLCGIKRLVREFRVFWLCKCNSTNSENSVLDESDPDESLRERDMDTSEPNKSFCETSDTSKPLDESCDNSVLENTTDKSKEDGHGCEISKRQLEKKIMAMAVREKRPLCKKTAWYVHEPVLAEFNLADIELPNTWEFLTSRPAKSMPLNPHPFNSTKPNTEGIKAEDASDAVAQTPKDQRSIMDFTKSKKDLESRGDNLISSATESPVALNKTRENLSSEADVAQEKKNIGQRSIMDFALSKRESANKGGNPTGIIQDNLPSISPNEKTKESAVVHEKKVSNQRSIFDFTRTGTISSTTRSTEKARKDCGDVIVMDKEDTSNIATKKAHKDCEDVIMVNKENNTSNTVTEKAYQDCDDIVMITKEDTSNIAAEKAQEGCGDDDVVMID